MLIKAKDNNSKPEEQTVKSCLEMMMLNSTNTLRKLRMNMSYSLSSAWQA